MRPSRLVTLAGILLLMSASCAKVLGIKDAELETVTPDVNDCGYSSTDECSEACIEDSCCSEGSACAKNTECSDLFDCRKACAKGDDTCLNQCNKNHSAGVALYTKFVSCLNACDCAGSSTGGATGAGGASSSGGASSGGTSSGGTTSTLPAAFDAAIQAYSQAHCAMYAACTPGWLSLSYGTTDECTNRMVLNHRWLAQLPGRGWDATSYIACASVIGSINCTDYTNGDYPAACVVNGTLANGAACNVDAQCASMTCSATGTSCGICVAAPLEGGDCIAGSCGPSLTCSDNDTCERPRNLGEDCTGNMPCKGNMDCYQSKCVLPQTVSGAACDTDVNLFCDGSSRYTCYTSTSTCVFVNKYADPGSSCGVNSSTSIATLCARGACNSSTTCVARAADHASCDTSLDKYCEWPAFCSDNVCILSSDVGICR
jgi:hypothetical protein